MNATMQEIFWKIFTRTPYALLILCLFTLSVITIVRAGSICDIRTSGPQVIVTPSTYLYIGVFLLAFTIALAGWFLRQIEVKNYEKLIILGLLIPTLPFMLTSGRVVVDPDYVLIEKGTRFFPEVQRVNIKDIDGVAVAYKEIPGLKGKGAYFFTWKNKSGKTGSAPLNAEMTAALPVILTVMELRKVPYLVE